MVMRGVQQAGAVTTTSSMLGTLLYALLFSLLSFPNMLFLGPVLVIVHVTLRPTRTDMKTRAEFLALSKCGH